MSREHFEKQMNRLIEIFGVAHYKGERLNLIWSQVQHLSDDWFQATITSFLCDFRQAPLIVDFREKASIERDRQWRIEKTHHKEEAERFFLFPPEEEHEIFQTIIKRLQGKVSDEDYLQFLKVLRHSTNSVE